MIGITDTPTDKTLQKLLQQNIRLKIDKKIWRTGKLVLFKQSGFFVELIIDAPKKRERFEIPIPYEIVEHSDRVLFDYRMSTLTRGKEELLDLIDCLNIKTKSRFYDSILTIELI